MKNLTLERIAAACGGSYRGDAAKRSMCVSDITTDSRKVTEGCLFVPIKGARADGHDFIGQVIGQGALCVLSERDLGKTDYPYIRVRSSLQAVKDIAEEYLKQLGIPVVGITGSVGKTSTKEMIAAVLGQKYRVLKTLGNFNNELGLPLTVFRLREEHQIAVLEMGISDFGEMERLAKIARPETAVITNIGCCHLENLKDRDGVFRAKTEIFRYVRDGGNIVLNGDDDKLAAVRGVRGIVPVKFGMDSRRDVYADAVRSRGLKGTECVIHTPQGSFEARIPVPGRHMVYNALAGTCVGLAYGLGLAEIRRGIESLEPLDGRFHIIETGRYTIVDDCYNANPVSMKASLEVLQEGTGRRIAVLGDMGELGENEEALHAEVGAFAGGLRLEALYCAGPLSRHTAEAARHAARAAGRTPDIRHYESREALAEALPALLREGDTVLVKASHFMQFEKLVRLLSQDGLRG